MLGQSPLWRGNPETSMFKDIFDSFKNDFGDLLKNKLAMLFAGIAASAQGWIDALFGKLFGG